MKGRSNAVVAAAALAAGGGVLALSLALGSLLPAAVAAAFVGIVGLTGSRREWAGPPLDDLRTLVASSPLPACITTAAGDPLAASATWPTAGGVPQPPVVVFSEVAPRLLDGSGHPIGPAGRLPEDGTLHVEPLAGGRLLWTHRLPSWGARLPAARDLVGGMIGEAAGAVGLILVLVATDGRVLGGNPLFAAVFGEANPTTIDSVLAFEAGRASILLPAGAQPVRVIEAPLCDEDGAPRLLLLLPEGETDGIPAPIRQVFALAEDLPLGIGLVDRDGWLVHVNTALRVTVGLACDGPLQRLADVVLPEDRTTIDEIVARIVEPGHDSIERRVRLASRPDEPVPLRLQATGGLGGSIAMVVLKDNREQLKLERQVAQAVKMQAVGQLAGGIAHDFNNILTAVLGHCDLLMQRHMPGEPDFEDINQIRQNANRAANLVRQLLAFSRQQTLRPQLIEIATVVGDLSHLLKRLLGERVTLDVRHARETGLVRADPGQLEQVIVNLAVNARDAMPEGGRLLIETFTIGPAGVRALGLPMMPPGDYVAIRAIDTGHGIPPEILGKVFEPFFTTKEIGSGTGLGLSTVYGIVKQTGGFIFADSPPGEGATFTIYLPRAEAGAEPLPAVPTSAPAKPDAPSDLWGSGLIMLVEDEATVRAVAQRTLQRAGYDVVTASDGEEALTLLEESGGAVDLLVSDIIMPGLDGPALVSEARRLRADLPVLLMSGYAEEQVRRELDAAGVAFLSKPFSTTDLIMAVKRALHPAGGPRDG